MKNKGSVQQWWDAFHPIDRESICNDYNLQTHLSKMSYYSLPYYIRSMFMGLFRSNSSKRIKTEHDYQP